MADNTTTLRSGSAATWVIQASDMMVSSNADGSSRMTVLTDAVMYPMGLNLAELVETVRISSMDTNSGVTIKLQYSPDGVNFSDAGSALITEKTATGTYVGSNSTSTELLLNVRVVAVVRNTSAAAQVTARMSAYGYYKYRV